MKIRLKVLCVIVLFGIIGSAFSNKYQVKEQQTEIKLDKIYSVEARGPFNLNIVTGARKDLLILPRADIPFKCSTHPKSHTLQLCINDPKVTIDVAVKKLRFLQVDRMENVTVRALKPSYLSIRAKDARYVYLFGNMNLFLLETMGHTNLWSNGPINIGVLNNSGIGTIKIKGLNSHRMTVNHFGSGSMVLQGKADVEKIQQKGKGSLTIHWIKSTKTTIKASGHGMIKLSGKADKLVAYLYGQTKFLAKPFIARDVLIDTYGSSFAQVYASHQIFAHATDKSQIDYYGHPPLVYPHTWKQGLVLPMS